MTPTVAAGIAIALMALLWLGVAVLIELDRQHEREWAAEAPEWTPPPIEDYRAEGECWDAWRWEA